MYHIRLGYSEACNKAERNEKDKGINMKFSIIVVCYNAGEKLNQTLISIQKQTYSDFEVVIKDGMSTDGSLNNLPSDDRIRLVQCKDKGIYDAMNQATKEARGEYILFLNCGDYFYQDEVLEKTAKVIADYAEQGIFKTIFYGDTFNEANNSYVPMPKEINAFSCYRHMPCHQAMFYHRSLFAERQYDLTYRIRGDYEHFLWSFFIQGICPVYLGFAVAIYEGGGYSESEENRARDKQEHKEITEKYIPKIQLLRFRFLMILTLAPLRKKIANSRKVSRIYNKVKGFFYK